MSTPERSDSDDVYSFQNYDLFWYERNEGPPIIDKKSRLLASVVQNQVDILQDLLDSPEWYNVTDKFGKSLLQIAVFENNKEVFDYMMSIPDFPINYVDPIGYTALQVALGCYKKYVREISEHFALELIKKGASIDVPFSHGDTALHSALDMSYNKVATLLIQKGADVNALNSYGDTPLILALEVEINEGVDEVVPALLIHGAVPSVKAFQYSLCEDVPFSVQEQLFLYLFDEFSELDVDLHIILTLARTTSPLFYELLKYHFRVSVSDDQPYFFMVTAVRGDYLRIVIKRFYIYIKKAFAKVSHENLLFFPNVTLAELMERLDILLNSNLRSDVISVISNPRQVRLFEPVTLIHKKIEDITEHYCFLLTYGLVINEWILHKTYFEFGCCELFKIFLHMDIRMNTKEGKYRYRPTMLFYDVTLDLDSFFKYSNWDFDAETSVADTMMELCKNFVHPRLKETYLKLVGDEKNAEIPNLPEIPLLTELARNVFRQYFIEFYQINTSSKFYTLLNRLPIGTAHKKILSYETKLYANVSFEGCNTLFQNHVREKSPYF